MKKPVVITLYHAEWCHYCKDFMPTWNAMKAQIGGHTKCNKNIELKEFEDSEINSLSVAEKSINGAKIEGYPTIKIQIDKSGGGKNYKEYHFDGNRSPKDIYKFVLNKLKAQK